MQKSISAFFPQDLSPAAVGMRERMRQAAETNRRIMEEEAARAEQRELEAIAAEQREFEQARQRRAQAKEAQRAAEKRKRIKDLEKRLCGYGELIPHKLYLGNAASAENEEWILDAKITGVVNCTPDIACYFERDHAAASDAEDSDEGGNGEQVITYENSSGECVIAHPHPEYLRISVHDSVNDSILKHFPKAIDFIEQNIANGGAVLVHCREGKSRSASVCAAYLMKAKKMKLTEALEFISENAWTPSINLTFLKELMQFEIELYPELQGKSSAEEAREDRDSRPEMTELHPGMSEKDLKKLAEQRAAYEKKLARKRTLRENKGKEFFPVPIDPNRECTGFFSIFAKYIKPSDEPEKKEDPKENAEEKRVECKEEEKSPEIKEEKNMEEVEEKEEEADKEKEEGKEEEDEEEKEVIEIKEEEEKENIKIECEEETKEEEEKKEIIEIKEEEKENNEIELKEEDEKEEKNNNNKEDKEDKDEKEVIEIKEEEKEIKGEKRTHKNDKEEKEEEQEQQQPPKKKRGRKKKESEKGNGKVQSRLESFFM